LAFNGQGAKEAGRVAVVSGNKAQCKVGDVIVRVDPRYFRPTEVETLLGDPGKAKHKLSWSPATTLAELARKMVESDYVAAKRDSLVKQAGYQSLDNHE
jgi:GDPmannose 4,6-dehydratase